MIQYYETYQAECDDTTVLDRSHSLPQDLIILSTGEVVVRLVVRARVVSVTERVIEERTIRNRTVKRSPSIGLTLRPALFYSDLSPARIEQFERKSPIVNLGELCLDWAGTGLHPFIRRNVPRSLP